MAASGSKSLPSFGFLTAIEHDKLGWLGGLLVVTHAGRPVEFHCTAPVKANRAQEILYGPTLHAFLFGEQIGQTLLSKSKTAPSIVCTDLEPMLSAREFTEAPMLLVLPDANSGTESSNTRRIDSAHGELKPGLLQFNLATQRVAVPQMRGDDRTAAEQQWQAHAPGVDLLEPFQRIRLAIEEAQGGK